MEGGKERERGEGRELNEEAERERGSDEEGR